MYLFFEQTNFLYMTNTESHPVHTPEIYVCRNKNFRPQSSDLLRPESFCISMFVCSCHTSLICPIIYSTSLCAVTGSLDAVVH